MSIIEDVFRKVLLFKGEDIEDPGFALMGRGPHVHDWRSYVPDYMVDVWPSLSLETRMCIAIICEEVAGNEEWD